MLKFLKITKVANFMDLFAVSGIVYDNKKAEEIALKILFKTVFLISIPSIFAIFTLNISGFITLISLLSLYLIILFALFYMSYKEKFPKKIQKIFKRKIKDKIKPSLKDEEFINFVKENYWEIRDMNLSKKETINLLNDWKGREKEINKNRIKKFKEKTEKEIEKKEKEIQILKEEKENAC